MEGLLQLSHFVEHWRLILWDKAFRVYFDDKGVLKFIKKAQSHGVQGGPHSY